MPHCPKYNNRICTLKNPLEQMQRYMPGFIARYCICKQNILLRRAPVVTGSVFMQRFRLFLGQCTCHTTLVKNILVLLIHHVQQTEASFFDLQNLQFHRKQGVNRENSGLVVFFEPSRFDWVQYHLKNRFHKLQAAQASG